MTWLEHNGVGLHWRQDGDPQGRPVLFLNSLGTDLRLWDHVLAQVPNHWRCLRMDTRGHGLSDAPGGPYSLDALTEDALALLDHLGVASVAVVGVSLGGMMAQAMAARRPEMVSALVLSNTAIRMGSAEMWQARMTAVAVEGINVVADDILARWFAHRFLEQTPELDLWRNMLVRTPPDGYLGGCAALAAADLSPVSDQIQQPALVIAGQEDGSSPPDQVRRLAEGRAQARYTELEGVGHLPMVEAPDIFARLVTDFLEEHAHV